MNVFSLVIIIFCLIRINNVIFAIFFAYAIKVFRNIIKRNVRYFQKVIAIKIDELCIFLSINV